MTFYPGEWQRRRQQQSVPLPPLDNDIEIEGWSAIVTGANTGVGYEIAKSIAIHGARKVILACRDEVKGRTAQAALTAETGCPPEVIEYRHLDLSSFASVRAFVQKFVADRLPLHILVNNAGVCNVEKGLTEDGLDWLIQVNHISPLLLTLLLIPSFNGSGVVFDAPRTSRIIWTVSEGAELVTVPELHENNPVAALCAKQYQPEHSINQYFSAKLLNIMCARELLERLFLQDAGIAGIARVAAAYPGLVRVDVNRHTDSSPCRPLSMTSTEIRTPAEAAKTVLVPTLCNPKKIWAQKHAASIDMKSMPIFENMELIEEYPTLARDSRCRNKVYEDTVRLMKLRPGEVAKVFLDAEGKRMAPPVWSSPMFAQHPHS